MKKKIYIVLDEEDQLALDRVRLDKEPEEALEFVMQRIVPQAKKKSPVLKGD